MRSRISMFCSSIIVPPIIIHNCYFAEKPKNYVIARSDATWQSVFLLVTGTLSEREKVSGLPRQCAHWLAMTFWPAALPPYSPKTWVIIWSTRIRQRGTWKGPLKVEPLQAGRVGLPSLRR